MASTTGRAGCRAGRRRRRPLAEVYGSTSPALTATVTIDVVARVRRYADSIETGQEYRYPLPDLAGLADLLDDLLQTVVDPKVVPEIAHITDIDPALVGQPRQLHLVAGPASAVPMPGWRVSFTSQEPFHSTFHTSPRERRA
ncbi:hypothetical protein [Streptomyces sp. NPDC003379]